MKYIYIAGLGLLLSLATACNNTGNTPETEKPADVQDSGRTAERPAPIAPAAPDLITKPGPQDETAAAATRLVKYYYQSIQQGNYASAYACWGDSGRASRQTFEEFRKGFAQTDSVSLNIIDTSRVDAAAGSRYVEVQVELHTLMKDNSRQAFSGKYVLQRAVVDGATPAQRTWHLYSAQLEQLK